MSLTVLLKRAMEFMTKAALFLGRLLKLVAKDDNKEE
jgi:hypothetical protein